MSAAVDAATSRRVSCPYNGLRHYDEEDAPFFFGREDEREVVAANLRARRLTVLYGESGVGKSSLLRAGVVSHLRELARRNIKEIGTPEFVPVILSSWSDDPLEALIGAFRAAVADFASAPPELPPSGRLDETIEVFAREVDGHLLIVLDQFEEYFLYHAAEHDDRTFAGELSRAVARPHLPASFLVAIREDALAKLDRFKHDIPGLFDTVLRVRHLDREAARAAIEKPLEAFNRLSGEAEPVTIEPALVEAVLDQVRTGSVALEPEGRVVASAGVDRRIETPYLQLVLSRLWEEERRLWDTGRGNGSPRLRLATLVELGGAEQIVRTHLDTTLGALSDDEQEIAGDVFRHLVTPSGTKIALAATDLAEYAGRRPGAVSAVLERLCDPQTRILRPVPRPPGEEGPPRYEIFHDVLAAAVLDWRTRHVQQRLARDKEDAERQKEEAELRARAERRRARIYRAVAIAAVAVLVVAAVFVALLQKRRADLENERAESRQVAAVARDLLDSRLDLAILVALEAASRADTIEARSVLLQAFHRSAGAGLVRILPDVSPRGVVALASDGTLAVAGDADITLWRRRAGLWERVVPKRARDGSPSSLAFRSDGALVWATSKGAVWSWSRRADADPVLVRRSGNLAWKEAVSPDGRLAAIVVPNDLLTLRLRARGVGHERRIHLKCCGYFGYALAFGGRLLAVADANEIQFTETETGARSIMPPIAARRKVSALALSADDKLVAFAEEGGTSVSLWSLQGAHGPRRLAELQGHTATVTSIAFSPDGRILATAGDDRTVILWDVTASASRRVGEKLRANGDKISGIAFDPAGRLFAAASLDGNVTLWAVRPRRRLGEPVRIAASELEDLAFTPDGKTLAAASEEGVLRVLDPVSGRVTGRLTGGYVVALPYKVQLAVDHQGHRLAAASGDEILLWDLPLLPGKAPHTLKGANAESIAFSPDGRTLASGSDDGVVRFWDSRTRKASHLPPIRLPGGGARDPFTDITTLGFSPDGGTIAAGRENGSVVLARVATPRRPVTLRGHRFSVSDVDFSGDGRILASASADTSILLWDAERGRLLGALTGHTEPVSAIAFSQDGKTLASTGDDATVRLWDTETRRPLGEPMTLPAKGLSVAFSPKAGGRLAVGLEDGSLTLYQPLLWTSDLAALTKPLCAVVGRNLNAAEGAQLLPDMPRPTCDFG